jgi:hypothetical protein
LFDESWGCFFTAKEKQKEGLAWYSKAHKDKTDDTKLDGD